MNEWAQVQNWVSYSDADGDPATQYQFWDSGSSATSGYFWTPANAHWPANTTIDVPAADLVNTWVRGGQAPGGETLWVRAFDGSTWSNWDTFTLTTLVNAPPLATIADHSLQIDQWAQLESWLAYSDAEGNPATKYQFWDSGAAATSGYFWTLANAHWPANTTIEVLAADLVNVWVRGGAAAGADTMWVRAFDGYNWGSWDIFTLATLPNTPPVATIFDHSLHINEWAQVQNWVSYSDANGDVATEYQFWDSGATATSGYFWTPANAHWPANTLIDVLAADLATTWVRGGAAGGAETLWVRAFDGANWGNWDAFTLTTLANTPPQVTIADHSLHINEWSQVQSWVGYSDADGNPATQYQFFDGGATATSGYFWTPTNAHWPAGTYIDVSAADLVNTWVRGGQSVGSETLWVRAFDGANWSLWKPFTLTTIP